MEEGLYLCSENKGADQLRSYCAADNCAADLWLCFCICKKQVSHGLAKILTKNPPQLGYSLIFYSVFELSNMCTVIILIFRTDSSGQTVHTQIRLL